MVRILMHQTLQHWYWSIWICFFKNHQPHGSFSKKSVTFNSNAFHFLDERKFVSYGWKIQWVVVSYEWRIWWVVSYKSVSYRKGLRVVQNRLYLKVVKITTSLCFVVCLFILWKKNKILPCILITFFSFSGISWNGLKIRKTCSTEVRALKVKKHLHQLSNLGSN